MFFKDGSIYEGEYKKDKKDGKGIYYFNDGTKLIGQFKNNKKIGKFDFYKTDGTIESKIYE